MKLKLRTLLEIYIIDSDQFAYKECYNTKMAFIKCQHLSLKWLENRARYVRVFSFDFKKVQRSA